MRSRYVGVYVLLFFTVAALTQSATYYHHLDHLSGQGASTNQRGAPEEVTDYTPYGAPRINDPTGQFREQRKFGGHEFDPASSLYYLGARYLDAARGQFLSQDPVFLDLSEEALLDPQRQHAYAFGRNNPLRYYDDTGEAAKDFQRFSPAVAVTNGLGQRIMQRGRELLGFSEGQTMGIYKGVDIVSNGARTGTGVGPDRQQCVGFAKEFYKYVYGVEIGTVTNAGRMQSAALLNGVTKGLGNRAFVAYQNGGATRPADDDLIVWNGGKYGHAGIIVSTTFNEQTNKGYVDVAEQNWGRGMGNQSGISRHELRRDAKGNYSVAARGSYRVASWVRLESKPTKK